MVTQKGKYVCAWLSRIPFLAYLFIYLFILHFLCFLRCLMIWWFGYYEGAFDRIDGVLLWDNWIVALLLLLSFHWKITRPKLHSTFSFLGIVWKPNVVFYVCKFSDVILRYFFIENGLKLILFYVIRFNRASWFWIRAVVSLIIMHCIIFVISLVVFLYLSKRFGSI